MKKVTMALLCCGMLMTAHVYGKEQAPEQRVDESERVSVTWENPKKFTDIRGTNTNRNRFRNRTLKQLHQYIDKLAQDLPDGQMLTMRVTDVDLAGIVWPAPMAGLGFNQLLNEIRIVRNVDFPRMIFSYELQDASGSVVSADEEVTLQEMGFLETQAGVRRNTHLVHEKVMLKRWFNKEFRDHLANNR